MDFINISKIEFYNLYKDRTSSCKGDNILCYFDIAKRLDATQTPCCRLNEAAGQCMPL